MRIDRSRALPIGGAPVVNEGSIDAGGGVRLFYRGVGDGADTIVVLHGGRGFTMDYIAADLGRWPAGTRSSSTTSEARAGPRS